MSRHGAHRAPAPRRSPWGWGSAVVAIAASAVVLVSLPADDAAPAGPGGPAGGGPVAAAAPAPPAVVAAPSPVSAPARIDPGNPADIAHMAGLVAGPSPHGQALQTRIQGVLGATPLRFSPDSPSLTEEGSRGVLEVAEVLRDDPDARIQVVGHTAMEITDLPLCQRLSEQRADLVAFRLMGMGIDAARLTVVGVSHSHPAPTDEASRRVELVVSG